MSKMYFILAWIHAIIQEQLHYVPLGWTKKYAFNESVLEMSCDTLDAWLYMVAQVYYVSHTISVRSSLKKIYVSTNLQYY